MCQKYTLHRVKMTHTSLMPHTYKYPRPALTVDCVIFGLDVEDDELQVLLIERGGPPFKGQWAIPGGFFNLP